MTSVREVGSALLIRQEEQQKPASRGQSGPRGMNERGERRADDRQPATDSDGEAVSSVGVADAGGRGFGGNVWGGHRWALRSGS